MRKSLAIHGYLAPTLPRLRQEIRVQQSGFQCKWNIEHLKETVRRVNKNVDHYRQVRSIDRTNWYFCKYSQVLFNLVVGIDMFLPMPVETLTALYTNGVYIKKLPVLYSCPPTCPPCLVDHASPCLPYMTSLFTSNLINIRLLNRGPIWILGYSFHEWIVESTNGINFPLMNAWLALTVSKLIKIM